MKVKIYEIGTTDGPRYGLMNAGTGQVMRPCAKWKTSEGAKKYAARIGCEVVKK